MDREWFQDLLCLFREADVLCLGQLVDLHLEELPGVFDFVLQFEELLERVVEEHYLLGCLVWQHLPDLFEALGTFEKLDDECLQILDGPDVALLVLHLVIDGVFDELEAVLECDWRRRGCVLVKPGLRYADIVVLGAEDVLGYFSSNLA